MHIVAMVRDVVDCRVPLPSGEYGSGPDPAGMEKIINPADWQTLQTGLALKESGRNHVVTVLGLGGIPVEENLRWCIAAGAGKAVRIWDECLEEADAAAKGRVLAAAFTRLRPDLIICGDSCLDQMDTELPGLAAAAAGYRYVPGVTKLESVAHKQVVAVRYAGKGRRERVCISLPALLTLPAEQEKTLQEAIDLRKVINAFSAPVISWDLGALGLSKEAVVSRGIRAHRIMYRFPVPATSRAAIPDSRLPADERIAQILAGPVNRKQGRIISGSPEQLAERIYQYLREDSPKS